VSALVAQTAAVAGKDLRIELRDRNAVNTLAPFAGTLLILFGLAFGPGRDGLRASAPAVLWLAVLFAGVLALRSSLEIETKDGALEGLVLSPVDPLAVYLGKTIAVSIELFALELVTLIGSWFLFDLSPPVDGIALLAAFLVGTVGFVAIGLVFAVLAARSRAREALFPVLLLPASIPVLLGGMRSTQLAVLGSGAEARSWLALLAAFAAVALASGCIVFEHVLEDA
jgi:heme exporter protein B